MPVLTEIKPNLYKSIGGCLFTLLEMPTLSVVSFAQWHRCSKDGEPSHPVRFNTPVEIKPNASTLQQH